MVAKERVNVMDIEAICEKLPVFPLPRTVLMPGALLPLHVFEPRYRDLVAYCMERARLMAVATLCDGYEEEYYGAPALHPTLGIGEIVAHQPFPDGRCNLALKYVGRAALAEELTIDTPFRLFRAEPIADNNSSAKGEMRQLRLLLFQLGMASAKVASEAQRLAELEDEVMVDSLARKVLDSPELQLAYLRDREFASRVQLVYDGVAALLAGVDAIGDA
jgi:Lon protease-like protein